MGNKAKNPPLSKRFTKSQIIMVIGKCYGVYTDICKALDCTAAQLTHYINMHSEIKKVIQDARDGIVDEAESVLIEKLHSKNEVISQRCAEFILKNLGKKRGYGEQPTTQINVKSESDIQVEINSLFGI